MRLCSTFLEELSECWLETCPLFDLFWTECLHMQLFLPLFSDLHSGICLETCPLTHIFQENNYVPSDASSRFACLKSCLFLQSQESFLVVFSSIPSISPGAKDGTDLCSLGSTWVCHQPTELGCTWNPNKIQGMPPKALAADKNKSLFRETATTLTPKEFGA